MSGSMSEGVAVVVRVKEKKSEGDHLQVEDDQEDSVKVNETKQSRNLGE